MYKPREMLCMQASCCTGSRHAGGLPVPHGTDMTVLTDTHVDQHNMKIQAMLSIGSGNKPYLFLDPGAGLKERIYDPRFSGVHIQCFYIHDAFSFLCLNQVWASGFVLRHSSIKGVNSIECSFLTLTNTEEACSNDGQAFYGGLGCAELIELNAVTPLQEALVGIALHKPACQVQHEQLCMGWLTDSTCTGEAVSCRTVAIS